MSTFEAPLSGRHFLQIPGPTNVPERVLQALAQPTIDHRSAAFAELTRSILERLGKVCKTSSPVLIYPSSGSGAWEAALVNTLSPGDRVLMCASGHFATLWGAVAERLALRVDWIPGDWRHGIDPDTIETHLAADGEGAIKAVAVVHNETSTGCISRIDQVRCAMNRAGHPALLLVDAISSLGSTAYNHDAWGVDVTVAASQKGLMLPPGLAFNALSEKAQEAARTATLPRSYWDWGPLLEASAAAARAVSGRHQRDAAPATPATPGQPGRQWRHGAWNSCASIRRPTPQPSPPWLCPPAATPTPCASCSSSALSYRWVPAWANSRGKSFASATWAALTT